MTLARPETNSKWPICMIKMFCLNENRKLLVNPSAPFPWSVISFTECAFGLSWWLGNWHVWTINLVKIYKNVLKYQCVNEYACDHTFDSGIRRCKAILCKSHPLLWSVVPTPLFHRPVGKIERKILHTIASFSFASQWTSLQFKYRVDFSRCSKLTCNKPALSCFHTRRLHMIPVSVSYNMP